MMRTEHLDRLDNIIVVFTLSLDQNLSGEKNPTSLKGFFFIWLNGLVNVTLLFHDCVMWTFLPGQAAESDKNYQNVPN